jgi:hypothetical protein
MFSGLELVEALQKLGEANDRFKNRKFTEKYNKMTRELDDRKMELILLISSPGIRAETKRRYMEEVEDIQLTFQELKRVADCVYDQFNNYPSKMPNHIEAAWSIYGCSIWSKKELLPFLFGLRAGYILGLKYRDIWQNQSDDEE